MYGFLYTKIISQDLPLFDNSILDFDSTIMVSMTEGVRGIFMGARMEAPCTGCPKSHFTLLIAYKTKPNIAKKIVYLSNKRPNLGVFLLMKNSFIV